MWQREKDGVRQMTDHASPIIKKLADLGESMGFENQKEVSDTILALKYEGNKDYVPIVDLIWSMELKKKQAEAIAKIVGGEKEDFSTVPIVGIEVEATDPTTKVLESDFANIAALGAPLGLIVSNSAYKQDIYRRTARMIRFMRHSHGDVCVLPFDTAWIPGAKKAVQANAIPIKHKEDPKHRDGEEKFCADIRKRLLKAGAAAGFDVVEEWTPPLIDNAFNLFEECNKKEKAQCLYNPTSCEMKPIASHKQYMTASRLDVVWRVKTKPHLVNFLQYLSDKDPAMRNLLLLNPSDWATLPVIGFEIESSAGKHAGGGLLNLGAHCVIGVSVVPDKDTQRMEGKLETYTRTLGLRNVYVRGGSCVS